MENHVDFLIRAKDLNVQRFLGVETLPDKLDTTIELILTRTQSKKKHKHAEKESQYRYICKNIAFDYLDPDDISDEYLLKLRIVRVEVSDGVFENIITTLSEEAFTPDDIKYCYNLRWGIETSFRDLKHTIGATNLHSKKQSMLHLNCGAGSFCTISVP
ncbi:MAG: transposase [Pilosibacter sp.]